MTEAMGCKSGDNESENGFNFKINDEIALFLNETHFAISEESREQPFRKTNVSTSSPLTVFGESLDCLYSESRELIR